MTDSVTTTPTLAEEPSTPTVDAKRQKQLESLAKARAKKEALKKEREQKGIPPPPRKSKKDKSAAPIVESRPTFPAPAIDVNGNESSKKAEKGAVYYIASTPPIDPAKEERRRLKEQKLEEIHSYILEKKERALKKAAVKKTPAVSQAAESYKKQITKTPTNSSLLL